VPKPPFLGACSHLARLLGRPRLTRLLELLYRAALRGPRLRRMLRGRLRRILKFNGRPADRAALDRLLRETAARLADWPAELMFEPGPQEALARVDLEFLPELERLRRAGRGVILAGPHMSNTPLCVWAVAAAGVPLNVVFINAEPYVWAQRENLRFWSLGSAAAPCLAALARNEAVLLYSDLDFFPGGRTANFFGAPVRPPHGPARLALASGAPILPVCLAFGDGRYRLESDAPLPVTAEATQESLEEGLLRSMERLISRYPAQWLLMRDIWDIAGTDRDLHRQLAAVRWVRGSV
jgi:KDO2-lipid IV(A) lauroyltransferase